MLWGRHNLVVEVVLHFFRCKVGETSNLTNQPPYLVKIIIVIIYLQPLGSSIHLLLSPLKLTSSPSVVQRTPASQSFCNRKHAGEDREPGDTDCDYWLKEVDNKVQYFDNENKKCRAITNMRVQPCNQ